MIVRYRRQTSAGTPACGGDDGVRTGTVTTDETDISSSASSSTDTQWGFQRGDGADRHSTTRQPRQPLIMSSGWTNKSHAPFSRECGSSTTDDSHVVKIEEQYVP
jgi:hypothetical protein